MFIFEDPKSANEFYNYINTKYTLNDIDVDLNVPFTVKNQKLLFSFYEVEITSKTVNLLPLAIDGALQSANLDPMMDAIYETRKGNRYIGIEVYDASNTDCLVHNFEYRNDIIQYMIFLKNEYLATHNYNEVLFKK